jgi:hypothetical protein
MHGKPTEIDATEKRLREIMLAYLQAARFVASWPGGDGLTIDDVLDSYAEAVARGQVPDWHQLLSDHPEMEPELHAWLATKDRWQFAFRRGLGAVGGDAGSEQAQDG